MTFLLVIDSKQTPTMDVMTPDLLKKIILPKSELLGRP